MHGPAFEALLEGVFDFAGLFPPAALPMDQAVRQFDQHLMSDEAWLVSRFVVPITWLADFESELKSLGPEAIEEGPWPVVILGSSLEAAESDSAAVARAALSLGEAAAIESCEVKASSGEIKKSALVKFATRPFDERYIELPWTSDQSDAICQIAEVEGIGVKARLGGLEASAFPTPMQVARFIRTALDAELPYKFTAGLHHPMRHFDAELGIQMHGFVNVLYAGALAYVNDLAEKEIVEILSDEDPTSFMQVGNAIKWGTWEANEDEIIDFRDLFRTIGSCSISDPAEGIAGRGPGAYRRS